MCKYASKVVSQAQAWIGKNEADGSHKEIIDVYNSHTPLARGYKVKYTDAWCATFVSAVAVKLGYTDIIPTECSCNKMIELFKKIGCYIEDESVVPAAGWIIFYDWDDNGVGDNTGSSDHTGIVERIAGDVIYVIEGNYKNAVNRREIKVNGKFIRGYGVPKYEKDVLKTIVEIAKEVIQGKWGNGQNRKQKLEDAGYDSTKVQDEVNNILNNKKTVEEIAKEVLNGKWGNGDERKNKLTSAGYDYNEVQKAVNALVSNKKTVEQIAKEVIQGKWGTGSERKQKLTEAGYDYNAVQKKVNELLS